MKQQIILKLASVEVLQNEDGTIQFSTENITDAMLDLTGRIFELEAQLNEAKTELLFAGSIEPEYFTSPAGNDG